MKILNRFTGSIIIERDVSTIKELVELAIKEDISLNGANLGGACLREVDFRGVDLRGVNFRRACLNKVDFSGVNLSGANFSRTDLSGVDFTGANLSGTDLNKADLTCTGDMKHIHTMQLDTYRIGFTKDYLQIGCKGHSIEEWKDFSDDKIMEMDTDALEWWNKWKDFIFKAIELCCEEKG